MLIRRQIKRLVVTAVVSVGLMTGATGGFYVYLQSTGNFRVVEKGLYYRSGQLSDPQLNQVIISNGIRSILNLRGASPGTEWYDDEIAISNSRQVVHYDYGISASRFVTPAQSEEILRIIRDAPKPILVHCQAGSD